MNNPTSIYDDSCSKRGFIWKNGDGWAISADDDGIFYYWTEIYDHALNIREELLRGE